MFEKKAPFYERHPALTGWLITAGLVAVLCAAINLAAG